MPGQVSFRIGFAQAIQLHIFLRYFLELGYKFESCPEAFAPPSLALKRLGQAPPVLWSTFYRVKIFSSDL